MQRIKLLHALAFSVSGHQNSKTRKPTDISMRDSVAHSPSDGTRAAEAAASSDTHIDGDVCVVFARTS